MRKKSIKYLNSRFKRYLDNGFLLDNGCTATGIETPRHKRTKDPHTRLASRKLSAQAKLLRNAKNNNAAALSTLTGFLATQIHAYGQKAGWQLRGRQKNFAKIVLHPYVVGRPMGKREAAKTMGICRAAFVKNWRVKIKAVEPWVKQWAAEIGQKPAI
ncbi:MAG: hypothetical protein V3T17_05075 [Pseudomonadales bacterium]